MSLCLKLKAMGNYVLRHFAQAVEDPQEVFQNIFMVAADERSDEFSDAYNPEAEGKGRKLLQTDTDIPADELAPNGGYDIARLANRTHVVWNRDDDALRIREVFQMGSSVSIRNALGKFGDQAKDMMNYEYFKERVFFHDLTQTYEEGWFDFAHNYQFSEIAVNIYEGNKFQKGETFPNKTDIGGGCTESANCYSNYCDDASVCKYGPPGNSGEETVLSLE